ncbi:MAG TPA: hypothetical protein VI365_03110 [Trebonia sp.]
MSLADWRPRAVEMARSVAPWPAAAFAHAPDATLTSFEYRLVRPAFAPATVVAAGQPLHDGRVELTVSVAGAEPPRPSSIERRGAGLD